MAQAGEIFTRFGRAAAREYAPVRRFRRVAPPSALIGLAAFSCVLVFMSASLYAASLPALIMSTQRDVSDGFRAALLDILLQEPHEEEPADAPAASDATAAIADASGAQSTASDAARPQLVIGGVSLQAVRDHVEGSQAPSDGPADTVPDDSSGSAGSAGGGDATLEPEPDPGPDPTVDQALYEYLSGRLQSMSGMLERVNACVGAFNEHCATASLETRLAYQRECDALWQELFGAYSEMLNNPLMGTVNDSSYGQEYGDIVGMYRCLYSYVGTIANAWTINVTFENPSEHVEEFMAPVQADMVNGENVYYTEFRGYYEGFVL